MREVDFELGKSSSTSKETKGVWGITVTLWLVRFWSAVIKHCDQSNLGRKRFISPSGLCKSITEGSQSKELRARTWRQELL